MIACLKLNLGFKGKNETETIINMIPPKSQLRDYIEFPSDSNLKKILAINLLEKFRTETKFKALPTDTVDSLKSVGISESIIKKLKDKEIYYWRELNDNNDSYYKIIGYRYFELVIKKGVVHVNTLLNL